MSNSGSPVHALKRGELLILCACLAMLIGFMTLPGGTSYRAPPDFGALPAEQKKQEFFAYLAPVVADVNAGMVRDRDRVVSIRIAYEQGNEPGWSDRRWLDRLAERLDVPLDEMELADALTLLERRAGKVPDSLVLAQAAIESGWGTSRFAREGNNFFGQRCYEAGCGISPLERAGAGFGLARFDSVAESVKSYILNLNTHPEYLDFRVRRQALRESGATVSGLSLLGELAAYSERGSEYLAEVRSMITANDLE